MKGGIDVRIGGRDMETTEIEETRVAGREIVIIEEDKMMNQATIGAMKEMVVGGQERVIVGNLDTLEKLRERKRQTLRRR